MADISIRNPRRKKGAKFNPKEAPFPVPIQSITHKDSCSDRWYYYTGYLRDNCVVIEDLGDLTFLYKMGFFGKGFLSRSKPEYEMISDISQKAFSKSEKLRRLPPREREIRQSKFRIIRKERYKNHKQWFEQASGKCLAGYDHVVHEDVEENTSKDHTKHDKQINIWSESMGDVSVKEFSKYHKRKRVDTADSDGESCESQRKLGEKVHTIREEVILHSSDDEDIKITLTDDDDIEECISNRELEEVVQDVVRKSNQPKPCTETKEPKEITQKTNIEGKNDPYKVHEHLQLTLEEAFFLAYGLGCLSVLNMEKRPMSLSEMWCSFCAAKQDFIPSYVTYHYFRSKGWIPKVGIKYGADWVLYKEGMPFYHSSYSVIVQMVESDHLDVVKSNANLLCRQLTWPQLCGVNRVSGHSAKEVMLCYVIRPTGMSDNEMSSPKCITSFKIQEVVLRRWIPERAREPEKNEPQY
ncbi:tRNA-splicing endonuclease subunit Sen2-like [Montipora foliosa]|uniref:tRNA-splicing endonuclease subunit Sen2-like n=1 Tax=Montipora foliosa TaxID=591990 RepID=UPI0035F19759